MIIVRGIRENTGSCRFARRREDFSSSIGGHSALPPTAAAAAGQQSAGLAERHCVLLLGRSSSRHRGCRSVSKGKNFLSQSGAAAVADTFSGAAAQRLPQANIFLFAEESRKISPAPRLRARPQFTCMCECADYLSTGSHIFGTHTLVGFVPARARHTKVLLT